MTTTPSLLLAAIAAAAAAAAGTTASAQQPAWPRAWGVEYFTAVNRTTSCTVPAGQDPEICSLPQHENCCFPGEIKQVARAFRVSRVAVEWDVIEGGVCGKTPPAGRKGVYGNWTQWDQTFAMFRNESIRQYGLLGLCAWPGNKLYDDGKPPHSVEATDAFVRWALTVMRRYNTPDAIWELWNVGCRCLLLLASPQRSARCSDIAALRFEYVTVVRTDARYRCRNRTPPPPAADSR